MKLAAQPLPLDHSKPTVGLLENHPHNSRLGEIILPSTIGYEKLLLSIIATLSKQDDHRWLTLLIDQRPSKKTLLEHNIAIDKMRVIYQRKNEDCRWLIWEALAQGNSHTVITNSCNICSQSIEQAAQQGNTQCLILKTF